MLKIILLSLLLCFIVIIIFFHAKNKQNVSESMFNNNTQFRNEQGSNGGRGPQMGNFGTIEILWSWFRDSDVQVNAYSAGKNFINAYQSKTSYIKEDSQNPSATTWTDRYNILTKLPTVAAPGNNALHNSDIIEWGNMPLLQYSKYYRHTFSGGEVRPSGRDNNMSEITNEFPNMYSWLYILNNTPFSVACRGGGYWWEFIDQLVRDTNILNGYTNAINNRYAVNGCITNTDGTQLDLNFDNVSSIQNCKFFNDYYINTVIPACKNLRNEINKDAINSIINTPFNTHLQKKYNNGIAATKSSVIKNDILNYVTNLCKNTGNTCIAESTLDASGVQYCFGPSPGTSLYTNALNSYSNVMNTYLYTTTTDIPSSQIIRWEQQLDSSFDAAIQPGLLYSSIQTNLTNFNNWSKGLFDAGITLNNDGSSYKCDSSNPTHLDASGIYNCFGNGPNSQLKQLQTSCTAALTALYELPTPDVSYISRISNNCNNFLRNNLVNTIADVSKNFSIIINDNSNAIAYAIFLEKKQSKPCPTEPPVVSPAVAAAQDAITVYNKEIGPYLDDILVDLQNIQNSLPNNLIVDSVNVGVASSTPFIKIDPLYTFTAQNDPRDGKYSQNVSFTVPQGNPGPPGDPGSIGKTGPGGIPGTNGSSGDIGIWEIPIQYQGIF